MDLDKRYTLTELQALFSDEPGKLRLAWIFGFSLEEQLGAVEDAIDYIARDFAETARHRIKRGEDALTIDVISSLKNLGFQATHDEDVGGHCDITVRGKSGFMWLAEAKIHRSYSWLLKGYRQLTTRYSTGLPYQNMGAMIIYHREGDTYSMMTRWKKYLIEHAAVEQVASCPKSILSFISMAKHPRSGLPFRVRHIPFSLGYAPRD
jgi:hypothetical protein